MKPLSPLTYYRRHKGRGLLLLALVGLATFGVCVMVRLPEALFEQSQVVIGYLTRFSLVSAVGPALEPGVVAQIRAHAGVAWAMPDQGLYLDVPLNTSGGFRVFGVSEAHLPVLLETCGLRLVRGQMLHARRNEIMLSQELADALGLRVGDQIGRTISEKYYSSFPTEMVVVGLLQADTSPDSRQGVVAGFVSGEYVDSHELYAPRSSLIVVPREGHKGEVDTFLEAEIESPLAAVTTYGRDMQFMRRAQWLFRLILGVVDVLAAAVIALVVGTIHRIGVSERLKEFGLLNALGYGKYRLIRRLTGEMAVLAGAGWLMGLGLSWLLFAWLKFQLLPPTMELELRNLTPLCFALPIPLTVVAFVTLGVRHVFVRLDAVAIVERGVLSVESGPRRPTASRSLLKPMSAWAFYLRHRGRSLALAVTIGLMIVGVVFPALVFAPMIDAGWLLDSHLRYVSVLSPSSGASIDPALIAQLRTHPSASRIIPAVSLALMIDMPPMSHNPARVYGVSEDDLQSLLDLYGARLIEGRLPRARSNELIVSTPVALNRGLSVGSKVGRPVYEMDYSIPTEMIVVGIFARPEQRSPEDNLWTGLASYEYLRSHELYASRPVELLVAAKTGHRDEVDAWLEQNTPSAEASVRTYRAHLKRYRQDMFMVFLLFGVPQTIIAVVAAVALSILSYTFYSQRRDEFGTLHALGRSRRWLVRRTLGETATVVSIGWLLGVAICGVCLAYIQFGLYSPRGLSLNFANPVVWLLTLPMPLAVIAVGTGLVSRMLSRLDPVSVIERR